MSDQVKAPVMTDVARLAGVSHQTVSRVINGAASIRPATRDRVLDAIEKLGYRPNTAARALVSGRSGMIGVIGSAGAFFGPTSIQRSVEETARAAGFFVSSVSIASVDRAELDGAMEHLMRVGVEGVVLVAGNREAVEVVRSRQSTLPVVVVEGDLSRTPLTVGVDQAEGARLATNHLLDLGHREIAHVAGPTDWPEAAARVEGWRSALAAAGVRADIPLRGDWSPESGYAAGQALAARPEVTAVFVANDQMAIGVLRALHEAGRRVPEDVSVVGFDDVPESAYLVPPLTSIRQDFATVGHLAIEALRGAIAGAAPTSTDLIPPTLVVRASTGPVPGGASS